MKRILILTACTLFGSTAVVSAQNASPRVAASALEADRAAVATIVMSSVAEVQLCGLATEKTQNPDVRSFCRSAVNDHARTAIAGMQLAQRLGAGDVKLEPLPGTSAVLEALTQYSGHDFDRAFLLAQIEDHENDEDELRYASEVTTETSVKSYETSVLPRVEKYLHLAEGALHSISRDQP